MGVWLAQAGLEARLPDLVARVRRHEAGEPAADDVAAVLMAVRPRG